MKYQINKITQSSATKHKIGCVYIPNTDTGHAPFMIVSNLNRILLVNLETGMAVTSCGTIEELDATRPNDKELLNVIMTGDCVQLTFDPSKK